MIICPAVVKSRGVSLTIRPVTHTAEVAVKTASTGDMGLTVEKGIIRRTEPIVIMARKPSISVLAGFICFFTVYAIPAL